MEFKLHHVCNVQVKLSESDCKWSPAQILKNLLQNYSTGEQKNLSNFTFRQEQERG